MEQETLSTAKTETVKSTRDRSASYPAISLGESVVLIEKIKKALANAPFNRETGAKAIGYAGVTGSSASKIAALVHFGLLQRLGDVYKISLLADRILLPKSEQDKQEAIQEAVIAPKLYKDLVEKFKNQSLPTLLSNILVHDHKIGEKVAKQVARDFASSMEFAGLLRNGVISLNTEATDIEEEIQGTSSPVAGEPVRVVNIGEQESVQISSIKDVAAVGSQVANLTLTYGRAQIILPDKVTKKDLDRIDKQIDAMTILED